MKQKTQQNQNSTCGGRTDQNRTLWLKQNFQVHEKGTNTFFFPFELCGALHAINMTQW